MRCIFCGKFSAKYVIRDANLQEKKQIARKTKETLKMHEKKKKQKQMENHSLNVPSQEMSLSKNSYVPNSSSKYDSIIKPRNLVLEYDDKERNSVTNPFESSCQKHKIHFDSLLKSECMNFEDLDQNCNVEENLSD